MISEAKLGDLFPSAQFLLDGFSKLYRLDRCSNGGGILLYVRDDVPSCLLLNSNKTESIFAEINFRKKKWSICSSYNPHKSNISNHLHHLGEGAENYIGNYNILLLGDFNSEFSEPRQSQLAIKTLIILLALIYFLLIEQDLFNVPPPWKQTFPISINWRPQSEKLSINRKVLKLFITRIIRILRTTTFAKRVIEV